MPIYEYVCVDQHLTEAINGFEVSEIVCRCDGCGKPAKRVPVYHTQFLGQATIPLGERDHRQNFSEYVEASEEISYHYDKADQDRGQPIKRPDLWGTARTTQAQAGWTSGGRLR